SLSNQPMQKYINIIEEFWESRYELTKSLQRIEYLIQILNDIINALNEGVIRVCEKKDNEWQVNLWLKKAISLYFIVTKSQVYSGGCITWYDKINPKFSDSSGESFQQHLCRVVPGAFIRTGSYIAKNVVIMPSFINIGAYIGEGTMIDSWATIGSCAQIGKNCHISGGVGIGGVLEPVQNKPVIIEDNCFIGARSEIAEGIIVEEGSVLSMGVFIGASTKIIDRSSGEVIYGRVPAYSVVVAGSMPAEEGRPSLYCAVIVKQVDKITRKKHNIEYGQMSIKIGKLKVIIETKTLVHALNFASSVVEKRNVIAELSNIKLSTKDGKLELITTNMEIYLRQKIAAQIICEGEITVAIKTLSDIVRKIVDKDITMEVTTDDDQIKVLGKNCTFNLLTLPVNQFPTLDDIQSRSNFKVPCRDFAKMIDSTLFSVSTDETRYNLNGVYFCVKEGECRAASTDGHRLSLSTVPITGNAEDFGVILPKKTLEEIVKIAKDSQNIHLDMEIFLSINKIKFVCNDIVMISKLIDGTFPDYQVFIPTDTNYTLTINTKLLSEVIDRVAIITIDKFQAVKLTLTKDSVEVTASGESRGVAKEIIPCSRDKENLCIFDHEEQLSIGFNPKYIKESLNAILNAIREQQVELHFSVPSSPMLLKPTGNSGELFVIMPVKYFMDSTILVSIVNPARIKGFAMSKLCRVKTDKVDSELIAQFCIAMKPDLCQPLPSHIHELQQLVNRLDALIAIKNQETN
ncbi:Beta sliding clamp, partial [Pseudolycoriella hygida]